MSRVAVVGAGMAGLVAARRLTDAGHDVVVLDKGRVVGGRTASRATAPGRRHDQGAQFVTLQHDEVADLTDALRALGALVPWFDGSPDVARLPWRADAQEGHGDRDGHPRYRGAPSARGPAQVLAAALTDVRVSTTVTRVTVDDMMWRVHVAGDDRPTGDDRDGADDHEGVAAEALVMTAPAPQATELLRDVTPDEGLVQALRAVRYEPCWTVLATPDGPPGLPPSGAARLDDDVVAFVADERSKGTAHRPAVTVHSTGTWAQDHLEDDRDDVGRALADAAARLLGVGLAPTHVHRWRHATPVARGDDPAPCGSAVGADGSRAPVVLAGDGYIGGRVEGAMLSGHLAAAALAARLTPAVPDGGGRAPR